MRVVAVTKCGCELLVHRGDKETCEYVQQSLSEKLDELPLDSGLVTVRVPASEIEEVRIKEDS